MRIGIFIYIASWLNKKKRKTVKKKQKKTVWHFLDIISQVCIFLSLGAPSGAGLDHIPEVYYATDPTPFQNILGWVKMSLTPHGKRQPHVFPRKHWCNMYNCCLSFSGRFPTQVLVCDLKKGEDGEGRRAEWKTWHVRLHSTLSDHGAATVHALSARHGWNPTYSSLPKVTRFHRTTTCTINTTRNWDPSVDDFIRFILFYFFG